MTPPTPLKDPYCGLFRRLAAMIYDGLLVTGILMVAAMVVVIPLDAPVPAGHPLFSLYLLAVTWAYFAISWRGGRTLGMKAWRIHIEAPEQPMKWWRTGARFFVAVASLAAFGLGFVWSLFHPQRASWHDLASGSRLRVEPKSQPQAAPE